MGTSPCEGGISPYSSKLEKFTLMNEGSKVVFEKPVSRKLLLRKQSWEGSPNICSLLLCGILSQSWRNILKMIRLLKLFMKSNIDIQAHNLTLYRKGRPSDWWLSVSCPPNLCSDIVTDWGIVKLIISLAFPEVSIYIYIYISKKLACGDTIAKYRTKISWYWQYLINKDLFPTFRLSLDSLLQGLQHYANYYNN